ncbi:MAG: hypothetical protein WD266_05390 [Balneolales bacterium]
MQMLRISLYIAFGCSGLLLQGRSAHAQQPITGPSTHLEDVKSWFANPALISFQRPSFGTGIKAYHLGLTGGAGTSLTQGFASISAPFVFGRTWGGGLNIQYFNSPVFRQTDFSAALSARIFGFVSVGGQVTGLNIAYNHDNFELDQTGDPVFQEGYGKMAISSSVGMYAQPADFIGFSFGMRNLNEPNLSLVGDDVKEPRELFAGLALVQGVFRSSFEIIRGRYDTEGMFFLEAFSGTGNYVRAGSNHRFDQGSLEGQLHIAGPLTVNYQYTLPLSSTLIGPSNGSHMFSVIFNFNRLSRLPDPVSPPVNTITFDRPLVSANLESRVYLSTSADSLTIYEKNISRVIDPRVSDEALANVSLHDVGEDAAYPTKPAGPVSGRIEFEDLISAEYNSFIQSMGGDRTKGITIIADTADIRRARALHDHIAGEIQAPVEVETTAFATGGDAQLYGTPLSRQQLPVDEKTILLEPEELTINLSAPVGEDSAGSWMMTIRDRQDRPVRTFAGTGQIPPVLSWDWRNEAGDIIEPGRYTCQLFRENTGGLSGTSNRQTLYVKKIERTITIHVTGDRGMLPADPDRIQILIKQ